MTLVKGLQLAEVCKVVDQFDLQGHVLLDDFYMLEMHLGLELVGD